MPVPPSIVPVHDHGIEIIHTRTRSLPLSQALLDLPGTSITTEDEFLIDVSDPSKLANAARYISRWLSVEGWLWFGQYGLTHTVRSLPRTSRIKVTFDSKRPLYVNDRSTLYHPLFMTQPTAAPVKVHVDHKRGLKKLRQNVKQRGHTHHYNLVVTPPDTYPGPATITRHVLRGAPWFTHVAESPGHRMLEVPDAADWMKHADPESWSHARRLAPGMNYGVLLDASNSELGLSALPPWLPYEAEMTVFEAQYRRDCHEQHMYLVIPGYAQRRAMEIMNAYSQRQVARGDYIEHSPTLRQSRLNDLPAQIEREGVDQYTPGEIKSYINSSLSRTSLAGLGSGGGAEILHSHEQRRQRNNTMFWYLPIAALFDEEALDNINHGGSPDDPSQATSWRGYPPELINAPDAPILVARVPISHPIGVPPSEYDAAAMCHQLYNGPAPEVEPEQHEYLELQCLPWVAATNWTDHEQRGRIAGAKGRRGRHEYDSGGIGIHLQNRAAHIFRSLMYEFVPDAGTEGAMMPVAALEDAVEEIDWQRYYDNVDERMLFFALINYVRSSPEFEEFNPLPDLDIPALQKPGVIETNRPGWNYHDHKDA